MEPKCQNCGKTKDEHFQGGGMSWCSSAMKDMRFWTPPAPQAALFEADPVKTGYEV